MKKAFLVIEVLISIVIIFLVIVSISLIYKQTIMLSNKNSSYEHLYITVKSVVNIIKHKNIPKIDSLNYIKLFDLKINSFSINVYIKKVLSNKAIINAKTYSIYYLYKVKIEFFNRYLKKNFKLFLVRRYK